MSGKMKTELYERLRHYNRWRRGDEEIPQPDPKELDDLIDSAADRLEVLELENKELFERWHDERRKFEAIEANCKDTAVNPCHGLAENCQLIASLRECFYLSRKLMESAACALDRSAPWAYVNDGLPPSGVPVPADSRKPESTAELDKDQDLALTGMALVTLGTAMQDKSKTIDELTVLALNSGVNIRFSLI